MERPRRGGGNRRILSSGREYNCLAKNTSKRGEKKVFNYERRLKPRGRCRRLELVFLRWGSWGPDVHPFGFGGGDLTGHHRLGGWKNLKLKWGEKN